MPQHRVVKHLKGRRTPKPPTLRHPLHPVTRAIATTLYTKTSLSFDAVAKELNLPMSSITRAVNLAKRKAEAENVDR